MPYHRPAGAPGAVVASPAKPLTQRPRLGAAVRSNPVLRRLTPPHSGPAPPPPSKPPPPTPRGCENPPRSLWLLEGGAGVNVVAVGGSAGAVVGGGPQKWLTPSAPPAPPRACNPGPPHPRASGCCSGEAGGNRSASRRPGNPAAAPAKPLTQRPLRGAGCRRRASETGMVMPGSSGWGRPLPH